MYHFLISSIFVHCLVAHFRLISNDKLRYSFLSDFQVDFGANFDEFHLIFDL